MYGRRLVEAVNLKPISEYLLMVTAVGVCLTYFGYFLLPGQQANNFPTYLVALSVIANPHSRFVVQYLANESSVRWLVVLLFYLACSSLWSFEVSSRDVVSALGSAGLVLSSIIGAVHVIVRFPSFTYILLYVVVCSAIVSGSLPIYTRVSTYGFESLFNNWRLTGFGGQLDNSVVAALSYSAVLVLAFLLGIYAKTTHMRVVLFFSCFFLLVVVFFSGSRGALLGIFAVVCLFVGHYSNRVSWQTAFSILTFFLLAVLVVTLWLSTAKNTPHDYSASALEKYQILANPEFKNLDKDGLPIGIKIGYGTDDRSLMSIGLDGSLRLSDTDFIEGVGILFPSFSIRDGFRYFVQMDVALDAPTTTKGFYVGVQEFNGTDMSGYSHVSRFAAQSEVDVIEATSVKNLVTVDRSRGDWQKYLVEYRPTARVRFASIMMSNQSGSFFNHEGEEGSGVSAKSIKVYEIPKSRTDLLIGAFQVEFGSLSGLFARDLVVRDIIWQRAIERIEEVPLLGDGISSGTQLTASDGKVYEHPHNILLSTLMQGGILGLVLIVMFFFRVIRTISAREKNFDVYVSGLLLAFSLTVLTVDGAGILSKVNYIWILIWLPFSILLSGLPGNCELRRKLYDRS